jgi:hypothetical protein
MPYPRSLDTVHHGRQTAPPLCRTGSHTNQGAASAGGRHMRMTRTGRCQLQRHAYRRRHGRRRWRGRRVSPACTRARRLGHSRCRREPAGEPPGPARTKGRRDRAASAAIPHPIEARAGIDRAPVRRLWKRAGTGLQQLFEQTSDSRDGESYRARMGCWHARDGGRKIRWQTLSPPGPSVRVRHGRATPAGTGPFGR